ncbi:unnamed protein product [Trichogramma brassicae]|uniref:Uncharacterized protein n=1 Tax=Trichogramma brassicae TaxID=86971 RepID=A0A6H5IVP1_9HYME|nr:unnamed protein product [Trichogramma brassicae]
MSQRARIFVKLKPSATTTRWKIVSKIIDEQNCGNIALGSTQRREKRPSNLLLRCGANPNSAHAQGSTALQIVCKRNEMQLGRRCSSMLARMGIRR